MNWAYEMERGPASRDTCDPWDAPVAAPPAAQPLANPEELEAISEAFYNRPWEDPTRYQDGFAILFGVMGSIAVADGSREWSQQEATQALRRVMRRVLIGEDQAEMDRR